MKAGIAVDNWKLPVFRQRLSSAGYDYHDGGPLTHDTTILTVETDDVQGLATVIADCQRECAKMRRQSENGG
jgi:hypothetical protein